jgi:hypothetical protein
MHWKIIAPILLLFTLVAIPVVHAQPAQTPCTPRISFGTLLRSVGIGYLDGRLTIGQLGSDCLPTPARQSTSAFPYDPDVGGKLTTEIKTADGRVLNTFVWYVDRIGVLKSYKVLGGYASVKPLTTGNYVLEFAADDKPFYRFPFSVIEGKNEDPYQTAGARYFIDGPWSEYGMIYFLPRDPRVRFEVWLQDKRPIDAGSNTLYDLKLINLKNGKVIGEESGRGRFEPHWKQADLFLHSATDAKKPLLKAEELLREDGRYAFRLTINGKRYGDYPFEVKGGQIQFQGNQIRGKTDPMIAISDDPSDGWWIKREPGK